MNKIIFDVEKVRFGHGYDILIMKDDGHDYYDAELLLKKREDGAVAQGSCLINENEGQALIDMLWTCGLRPSEGSGSAGAFCSYTKTFR